MDARATLQQALRLHLKGNLAEAERAYRAVLQQQPLNATALHHLGLIAKEAGHHKAALELIAQSLSLDPSNVAFRVNQIGILDHFNHRQPAEDAARKLIDDRPDDLKLRADLARLLVKYGKVKDAAEQWEIVVARAPTDAAVLFHSAHALQSIGQTRLAEERFEAAIKIKPDFGEAMLQLGYIYYRSNRMPQCREILRKAVPLLPGRTEMLITLAHVLIREGHFEEGLAYIAKARELAPEDVTVLNLSAFGHLAIGDASASVALYERAAHLDYANLDYYSGLLHARLYVEASGEEELAHHRAFQARCSRIVQYRPQPAREIAPGERLRIGYVSPDFRNHPVGLFMEPLLAQHDRARFEVHCFSNAGATDALTDRVRTLVDAFHDIPVGVATFDELDALIRSNRIDILIDLTGHTEANCLRLFARKPAPVQITYLGYPNTTGLSTIDFRISDAVADPPGNEAFCSERLLRLPGSFGLFAPPPDAPAVRPSPLLANGYVTFGTLGRIQKWSPATLESWSRIFKAVPDSRFRLIGSGYDDPAQRANIIARLTQFGIDSSRVEMIGQKPFIEYLSEISNVDLLLDTNPFNGHTTTLQALCMGVPTVTLAGKLHRSRMGASIMTALGAQELIADSPAEYERIAIELARNPSRLTEMRNTLRDRLLQSSLCDGPTFARAFEALLLRAWEQRDTQQSEWDIS